MLMNDTPMPIGMPFEPFHNSHSLTLRYRDRQLIDDIAGEDVPADVAQLVVCMSDLPPSTKIVRPGMLWPQGLLLPNDTMVIVVDNQSIIRFVGSLEDPGKLI
ncbi:hypothetical protein LPJ66_005080 [Kickxella alabastrina]|uniref:Uncharacterized protein n=1 Tax=Kickxella alabastrina TaxID=61397 RepID=A0ACC1IJC6_9FUNG|nr:hypothetical protein LPJ66_005080 [Kickxella alabastrina]